MNDTSQRALLDAALDAAAAAPGALLVFDIDDTLLSTGDRHRRILAEYAARLQSRAPRAAKLLSAVRARDLRYQIVETARAAGVDDEDILRELREFWFARFFRNEYLLEDAPTPGAPEFCAEALRRGATIVYATGRDERMRAGTERSLALRGFPAPDGRSVRLKLKPRFDTPDAEFKAAVTEELAAWGEVAATFENEPLHANLFREAFPRARHFLLETRHSGRPATLHAEVLRVADFRR